jgi:RecJ-like exonuclease
VKDKAVEVRGKVVKVNPDIMGKTWIHLRDGTGDAEARTNDLTITTGDSAAVGDIVLVKGTVRTDINLGMGYIFSVMIDNATVVKQ